MKAQLENPEDWVDLYGDFLYRFAFSRIKDPSVAEDLVQEAFLAALNSHRNFRGRSTARKWLIAILKHKIVGYIRKKVREQPSDKLDLTNDGFANAATYDNFNNAGNWQPRPAKWAVNPTKLYEQKEFTDILYRC